MAPRTATERCPGQLNSTFDGFADSYEEACHRGLSLTGESREFFSQARIRVTANMAPPNIQRVLDFGCGLGHSTPLLREAFPAASVCGVDNSIESVKRALAAYGGPRVQFSTALTQSDNDRFDLAYCNGVFHHVPPPDRLAVASAIFAALRPGGIFAFWENNPWNPGTRLVMSRIPFDRDAIMLWPSAARRLLAAAGFNVIRTAYHFFFPSPLGFLRPLEAGLNWLPLGGQFCIFARKPSAV